MEIIEFATNPRNCCHELLVRTPLEELVSYKSSQMIHDLIVKKIVEKIATKILEDHYEEIVEKIGFQVIADALQSGIQTKIADSLGILPIIEVKGPGEAEIEIMTTLNDQCEHYPDYCCRWKRIGCSLCSGIPE